MQHGVPGGGGVRLPGGKQLLRQHLQGFPDQSGIDLRGHRPDHQAPRAEILRRKAELLQQGEIFQQYGVLLPGQLHRQRGKKLLAAMYFMLKGLPFIYQGQELGMENVPFSSIDEIDDISTLDEYQVALNAGLSPADALHAVAKFSRDNARTPMQWSGEANAGFTTGKPWLKVNPNYTSINAADQLEDPDSVRSFYKELIALRKDPDYKETVVYGELKPYLEEQHNLMAYYRKGEQTLLVIGNYQMEEQTVELPSEYHSEYKKILLNNYPELVQEGTTLILHGYQVVVLEM